MWWSRNAFVLYELINNNNMTLFVEKAKNKDAWNTEVNARKTHSNSYTCLAFD